MIVIVPSLRHDLPRNGLSDNGGDYGTNHGCTLAFTLGFVKGFFVAGRASELLVAESHNAKAPQSGNTHANPYSESVERASISIVTLTRLSGSLVKIQHDGNTGQEEEEEYHPELLNTALGCERLPAKTDYTKEQGDHIEHIVSGISFALIIREETLITKTGIVYEGDTANPVALINGTVALNIVLTAGKVPHEISPIHVIELIAEEELHVFTESGSDFCGFLQGIAFSINIFGSRNRRTGHPAATFTEPVGISSLVLGTVYARKNHVKLRGHDIFLFASSHDIFILFTGNSFNLLGVKLLTLSGQGSSSVIARHLINDAGVESLAIKKRPLAVLLAVKVGREREHIVRSILIHRRMSG